MKNYIKWEGSGEVTFKELKNYIKWEASGEVTFQELKNYIKWEGSGEVTFKELNWMCIFMNVPANKEYKGICKV